MNIAQEAVDIAGTQKELALASGVTQQAVQLWVRQGWIPPKNAKKVSERTGIDVMRILSAFEDRKKVA